MPDHGHHSHGHGHHHDRGWRAVRRYLRLAPKMWSSATNRVAIHELAVHAGEHALDIGAGMGAGTMLAARAGAHVVAVEPTPFLRRVLRMRRLWQRARRRIDVEDGAAERLPVPDASIDVAWALNVMHHFTDVDAATSELRRVMRSGGRVLLVDENFDDPAHPEQHRVHRHRQRGNLHFDHVDPTAIGSKLGTAGFAVREAGNGVFSDRPAKVVRATRT